MNSRGCHFIPSGTFSLTVPRIFVGERFCVSEKIWKGKNYEKEGSIANFVDNFLCHMPKDFVGEQFCVLENVWYEKKLSNGWGVSRLSVGVFFVSQCRKIL